MADNTKAITKPENLAWGLWTHDEVELIRDTYFPKATVNELRLFLTLAAKRGLEPGIQLIAVKFKTQDGGERVTFITPIDGYRSLADRTGNYAGSDEYLFDDGLTEYQHIVSTKEKPITATATVYKVVGGMRVPFVATVRWDEYYPTLKNKQFMWDKMPYLMLGKCAEALALRKAFPEQMSGIYTDTEMEQAYGGELVEPAKKPPTVNKPDQKALPPQKPANDKRNAYKPDELIKALNKTVSILTKQATELKYSDRQRGIFAGHFEKVITSLYPDAPADLVRHDVFLVLFGKESVKDLTPHQIKTIDIWSQNEHFKNELMWVIESIYTDKEEASIWLTTTNPSV